jgi:hypothetical protein
VQLECLVSPALPPLAWVARIRPGVVTAECGSSVRREQDGFFEGTWAGPPEIGALAEATTVFGLGIVLTGDGPLVVPPSHTLDGVFLVARNGELVCSNSLVGLLVAGGLDLDPEAPYPRLFGQINQGLSRAVIDVPTAGPPIRQQYFDNLLIGRGLAPISQPKPREAPFASFEDYRTRLVERVGSAFANAPGYRPLATISSGYDSTASAAVAAAAGCREAMSFATGEPWRGYSGTADSGAPAAAALGMSIATAERLAYMQRDDAPEAEFLANGMSGEDVFFRSAEQLLARTILVSGFWGGAAWRGQERSELQRIDLSGASLLEFRLRTDFINLPVPYIGGTEQPGLSLLARSPEMRVFDLGTNYEEPLARRLAEEAGVPRGSFGIQKKAATVRLHRHGLAAMSESGRRSFEAFAGHEALARLPQRAEFGRRHRAAIHLAHGLRLPWLAAGIEQRRRESVHFEPTLGTLLLRWAVEQVRPRYAAVTPSR